MLILTILDMSHKADSNLERLAFDCFN